MPDLTINKYKKEIQQWGWATIKKEALNNIEDREDGEGREGSCFIGTVFNLMPSGKYYMPWARSNVDLCPKCNGEKSIARRRANKPRHIELVEKQRRLRVEALALYGAFIKDQWTLEILEEMESLVKEIELTAPTRTCPMCGGIGSREAYLDSLFQEALEAVAEEHGMYITNGEGDPCNTYAVIAIDSSEDETEVTDYPAKNHNHLDPSYEGIDR